MVPHSLVLAAVLVLSGCASLSRIPDENAESSGIGNAIVIEQENWESARGGVLTILQSHVRGMSVARENVCPHIVLRGGAGRSQAAEAVVYLDGQRMSDTCILEGLAVDAIQWAEVYPGGVTHRPGYRSNTGGLILFFMKNGAQARLWQ